MPIDFQVVPPRQDNVRSTRFETLVLPCLDAAYNLAHWLARNDADAQDVVQEAMLRALRYFDSFHGNDARVWLLAIVRNTYYTLRTKSPQGSLHERCAAVRRGDARHRSSLRCRFARRRAKWDS